MKNTLTFVLMTAVVLFILGLRPQDFNRGEIIGSSLHLVDDSGEPYCQVYREGSNTYFILGGVDDAPVVRMTTDEKMSSMFFMQSPDSVFEGNVIGLWTSDEGNMYQFLHDGQSRMVLSSDDDVDSFLFNDPKGNLVAHLYNSSGDGSLFRLSHFDGSKWSGVNTTASGNMASVNFVYGKSNNESYNNSTDMLGLFVGDILGEGFPPVSMMVMPSRYSAIQVGDTVIKDDGDVTTLGSRKQEEGE